MLLGLNTGQLHRQRSGMSNSSVQSDGFVFVMSLVLADCWRWISDTLTRKCGLSLLRRSFISRTGLSPLPSERGCLGGTSTTDYNRLTTEKKFSRLVRGSDTDSECNNEASGTIVSTPSRRNRQVHPGALGLVTLFQTGRSQRASVSRIYQEKLERERERAREKRASYTGKVCVRGALGSSI